jgi:AcrR family transcriptional regulator
MKSKTQGSRGSRERILHAALSEFAEHGLAGARVDRIAGKAGVNKAMIYYHFDSKEDLYMKVLEVHIKARVAEVAKGFKARKDLEGILQMIAETYYKLLTPGSPLVRLFLREMADRGERLKRIVPDLGMGPDLRDRFRAFIEKGMKEGRFRDLDIRHTVVSFVGMCVFYLLAEQLVDQVWEIDDARKFREERPKEIVDLFMRGLEAS